MSVCFFIIKDPSLWKKQLSLALNLRQLSLLPPLFTHKEKIQSDPEVINTIYYLFSAAKYTPQKPLDIFCSLDKSSINK